MWTSLLVCGVRPGFSSPRAHVGVCCARVCDPVCCALACGYLEVSADVDSACGSGFTISCLMEPCINSADSIAVGGRSFCLPCLFWPRATFYSLWDAFEHFKWSLISFNSGHIIIEIKRLLTFLHLKIGCFYPQSDHSNYFGLTYFLARELSWLLEDFQNFTVWIRNFQNFTVWIRISIDTCSFLMPRRFKK